MPERFLKRILCRELHGARVTPGSSDSCIGNAKEPAICSYTARKTIVLRIERVLHLDAQFEQMPLCDTRDFAEAQIQHVITAESEEVTTQVAEIAGPRSREHVHLGSCKVIQATRIRIEMHPQHTWCAATATGW